MDARDAFTEDEGSYGEGDPPGDDIADGGGGGKGCAGGSDEEAGGDRGEDGNGSCEGDADMPQARYGNQLLGERMTEERSPEKGGRSRGRGGGGGGGGCGGSRIRSRGRCSGGDGRIWSRGRCSGGGDRSRSRDGGGGGGGGGGNGRGDRASTEADAPHLGDLKHDVHMDGTDARADHPDLAGPTAALPPDGASQPRA
eukprot:347956-Chlamydomonas_euryale.AAC.2